MASKEQRPDDADRTAFVRSLEQREAAARGLEGDLLTQVPLLYGQPGRMEPDGDPGVTLARFHREEMVRRNGGGIGGPASDQRSAKLPFEGALAVLGMVLVLLHAFGAFD